jgi:hypothetical protein
VINIKSKTILVSLVIVSLLFISPYVESFSFGDLGDVVNYVLFNSFQVISGHVAYVQVMYCDADSTGECTGGSSGGGGSSSGICGDGTRQEGEVCDPGLDGIGGTDDDDFGEIFPTCESRFFDGGELECTDDCDLIQDGCYSFGDTICNEDYENCYNSPEDCGGCMIIPVINCAIVTCAESYDDCEGENTLDCTGLQVCGHDMFTGAGCVDAEFPDVCGDGTINTEIGEECEHLEDLLTDPSDDDLGIESCNTLGYDSGTLRCDNDCTFDEDRCVNDDDSICSGNSCGGATGGGDDGNNRDPAPVSINTVTTCAAIAGICTNSCGANYAHFNGSNDLDGQCVQQHGDGLVCCIPNYVLNSGLINQDGSYVDDDDSLEQDVEFSGNIKTIEDYAIQKEQEAANAPQYTLEGGLSQVLTSPSYAMGSVWIIFVLTAVVVGMTYYLHTTVGSNLKRKKKRK